MLRFSLLGSGSSGNAILVASPTSKILIDNGLSFRQLEKRAAAVGESVDDVDAVFITHEHGDHVKGVGIFARKMNVPVYLTPSTFHSLPKSVGDLPGVNLFEAGEDVQVNGFTLKSFSVSHDAADPVSYVVRYGDYQLGLATDLGHVSNLVRQRLQGSHALILESNYCPKMLQQSSYPLAIRQRIRSNYGHLSNSDMNSLLSDLLHDDLQVVVVVHVSQENNTEELVHRMASGVLKSHDAELVIASQDAPTPVYQLRA